jgi:hypothetical protein
LVATRLTLWITFGVIFGLLPIVMNAFKGGTCGQADFNFTDILGKGDLFVIAAVVAGGCIGELLGAFFARDYSRKGAVFKVMVGLATFGTILAVLANIIGYFVTKDPLTVRTWSEWVAGFTLVSCAAIVALAAAP